MADVMRTWDGLEIAPDDPRGSTVVVRRVRGDGSLELLLLHRNANGPDFQGDWAWTSPAGARQPGEAVYAAALRELGEEAGLHGQAPFAVDLSGFWATFAIDLIGDDRDDPVVLVDPEHDRYVWLPPVRCRQLILPTWVGNQQVGRGAAVPMLTVDFRPMHHDDLPALIRWQQAPHADRWFHGNVLTLETARERYGPRINGVHPTRMWVVRIGGADAGYVQDYRVSDHDEYAVKTRDPDAVAFDYLIGDPRLVGRGLGTRMIWTFLRDVLVRDYPDVPRFLASPDHRNAASRRALVKCGFSQGDWIDMPSTSGESTSTEVVYTFDCRHWFG